MAFCTTALGVSLYSHWQRSEIGSSLFTGPFKFSVDGGDQLFKTGLKGVRVFIIHLGKVAARAGWIQIGLLC